MATKTKKSTMTADEFTPEPLPRSGPPLRLRRPRKEAAGLLRNQLKIGHAICNQRLGSHWDLDQARAEKQEWVQRTTDLLNELFSDESVAEHCNEWYGTVLPEYAEIEMFIEQFEQEMKTRLGKLQAVLKLIDSIPEPPTTIGGAIAAAKSAEAYQSSRAPSGHAPSAHLPPAAEMKAILKPAEPSHPHGPNYAPAQESAASEPAQDGPADPDLTVWSPPPAQSMSAQPPSSQSTFAQSTIAQSPPAQPSPPIESPLAGSPPPMTAQQVTSSHAPSPRSHQVSSPVSPPQPSQVTPMHQTSSTTSHASTRAAATAANGKSQRSMLALVLHGQVDPARRDEVEKFLAGLGLAPTVIERVSARTFAIDIAPIDARGCAILLLGDAILEAQDASEPQPPDSDADDLMFLLGLAVGRFGGRICVLQAATDSQRHTPALSRAGFSSLLLDGGEGWKLQLARQLKSTGLTVDLNRLV